MTGIPRRQVFHLAGMAAVTAALGACDKLLRQGWRRRDSHLRWWDHLQPNSAYEKKVFADFAKEKGGAHVEYTVYDPQKMGQALQLAKTGKQLPDVFTAVGIQLPASALVSQGWFTDLELDDAHKAMLPKDVLINGKTVFGGKVYSFPTPAHATTTRWTG